MGEEKRRNKKAVIFVVTFLVVNLLALSIITVWESVSVNRRLTAHAEEIGAGFDEVMDSYEQSFKIFAQMMGREVQNNPNPDILWDYLKSIDAPLLAIEGETFDGLYMYYQGRYLYSWDKPYSAYEETGYVPTERPWYKDAVAGKGEIVFTPPYMSYANHYILTTISQLQPDGETVFAYDIKMGDIQKLVSSTLQYDDEQIMIFDQNGTVIGSTNTDYLGGNLKVSLEDTAQAVSLAQREKEALDTTDEGELTKAEEKVQSAAAFYSFRQGIDGGLSRVMDTEQKAVTVKLSGSRYYAYLNREDGYSGLVLVPVMSMLKATLEVWLVPLLIVEILLIYVLGRISKEQKNRELKNAYVELGQTQRRLEIALSAAKKAAAIDELTGMMNDRSFRKEITKTLDNMDSDETGILIMMDGDHFKEVNDNYGHNMGDEVIKLSAQMIIGRIRVVDLASRLHGDEFAIFVTSTADYAVARRIVEDINNTIAREAKKMNIPPITLSGGAVIARHGDTYVELSKAADKALYKAKETHDGGFAY